jgi:uncharacterized phage-like protein YoqJ
MDAYKFNKEFTVCFTGHRPKGLPWGCDESKASCKAFIKHLTDVLENAINAGYVHFISGLALGIDMIAADIVLSLKKKHKNVTLTGAVPCPGQEEPWRESDQKRYKDLIKKCDQIVVCSDSYNGSETMHIRNHFMVDNSAVVVAIWNGKPSGTGSTVKYAKEHGCKVKIINPDDFR